MSDIPRSALLLTIAGVIPFVWGALTTLQPVLGDWGRAALGPRFVGPYVQLFYGAVILSFMSGVLWGFATAAPSRDAPLAYALSVVPALWVFFTTGGGPQDAGLALVAGFIGILGLDAFYWARGLAPPWWLALRVPVTAIVVLCIVAGLLA